MGTLPYLPGGKDKLPAERVLIFSDPSNQVQRISEDVLTLDGDSFTGHWESPTLNRDDKSRLGMDYTLRGIMLFYSAPSATKIKVRASGDGGRTWDQSKNLGLEATGDSVKRSFIAFNVTGYDLRFRMEFQDAGINIFGYRPRVHRRADTEHERDTSVSP